MAELGQYLQAKREEKGWELDEVQTRTKIQKRYLLAIEEGRYDDLPGAFYARAFIKSYAEALELEPEEVFAEYEHDLPKPRKESVELPTRGERSRRSSQENEKKNPMLPAILVVAFLVAVVGVIWLMNIDAGGDMASEEEEGNVDIIEEPADEETGEGENENAEEEANEDEEAESADENDESNGNDTNGDNENENGSLTFDEVDGFNSIYTVDSDSLEMTLEFDEDTDSYVDFREEPTDDGSIVETAEASNEASEQEFDFSEHDEITINAGYTPALTIYVNGEELEYELDPGERDFQRITIQKDE